MFSFHNRSIARNPSSTNTYPNNRVNRAPWTSMSFAERGAQRTIRIAAGRMARPASMVEYPSTF
jgi:hypothetical protein